MNETLQNNLRALSIKNPALAQKLLTHSSSNIDFDQATSGDYNLIVDGIHIHDTENPQLEAKLAFGKEEENDENDLKFIFGLGLGYLFKRAYISSKSTIILFEPSLNILKTTLEVVDFSSEISDLRVFVITELSEIRPIFLKYLYKNVSIFHLDIYKNMFPELYEKAYFELNQFHLDQQTNMIRSENIANKIVGNIPYIANLPSITILKDLFINKSILIVGAGPSLNKSIDIIKKHRSKFIIICIGRAFKALYLSNIIPDFVIAIDIWSTPAQIESSQEVQNQINLILQPSTDINFFKEKTNSTFIYYPSPDYISEWLANKNKAQTLTQAGSVSLCAFYTAIELGAQQIILIGQDLAYSEGNIYASNTSVEEIKYIENDNNELDFYLEEEGSNEILNKEKLVSKNKVIKSLVYNHKNVIKIVGQKGENLLTSPGYASFITQYSQIAEELLIKNPFVKLINASVGGAYIKGFEHKPLDQFLDTLPVNEVEINKLITQYCSNQKENESINLKLSLKKLIIDLKSLIIDSEKVVKNANRLLIELERTKVLSNKVLEGIKKLQNQDKKIKNYNTKDRVSFMYPFIQKELFEHNRVKDRAGKNDLEKARLLINTIQNFSEIMIIGANKVITRFNQLDESIFK